MQQLRSYLRASRPVAAAALLFVAPSLARAASPLADDAATAMRQALAYLDATQVTKPDRLAGGVQLNGEWPSYVRGNLVADSDVTAIYDSNAFVPMFVLYPMLSLSDADLPESARRVTAMKKRALPLLRKWYVSPSGTVNFWPTIDGFHGPQQIMEILPMARALRAVFDVADDADDTAVYHLTLLKLLDENPTWAAELGVAARPDFASDLARWRDAGRVRKDVRDAWKPDGTGAFMTWLDDEEKPGNRLPITYALANNVDCTVAANALYAVGVGASLGGGSRAVPGYEESCALLRKVVVDGSFPVCSHYYPAEWLFPYAVGRAFADGGVSCLDGDAGNGKTVLATLLERILARQIEGGDLAGAWNDTGAVADLPEDINAREPEFQGSAHVLSTALNVVTLYNLHAENDPRARAAIERGLRFILDHRLKTDAGLTFWQGGVFFSSSIQQVARWKSRPYTTSVVLEALISYLRDPEGGGRGRDGRWRLTAADVPAEWLP
jgi:hypothetical protein